MCSSFIKVMWFSHEAERTENSLMETKTWIVQKRKMFHSYLQICYLDLLYRCMTELKRNK